MRFPKYNVPTLALNGNTGSFQKTTPVENAESIKEAIVAPLEVIMLKKRKTLSTKIGTEPEYFSSEFTGPNDVVTLYQKVAGKIVVHSNSTAADLRQKNPSLKTVENVYCLYKGEVCKLVIRGGSSGNFYDFQNEKTKEGKHSFEYVLSIGSKKMKHEKTRKEYYAMTFTDKPVDVAFDLVEEKMNEVSAAVKKMDDYQTTKINQSGIKVAAPIEATEDIDTEDIPF